MTISITHRQAGLSLLSVACIGAWLALISSFFQNAQWALLIPLIIGALLFTGLLIAYLNNWLTGVIFPITLICYTLIIGLGIPEPFVTQQLSLAVLTPSLFAAIVLDAPWVIGCGLFTIVSLLVRGSDKVSVYQNPINVVIFIACVAMITIIQLVAQTMLRDAQTNAKRAEDARKVAEQQAEVIRQNNQNLHQQSEEQRRLIELISLLETPMTSLADGVLFAPIVGHMDTRRADLLRRRILQDVYNQRAKLVVLDLAGVMDTDTAVAKAIIETMQAVRLLGCEVVISGISASLAELFTKLNINLLGVHTVATPQVALEQYLTKMQKSSTPQPRLN